MQGLVTFLKALAVMLLAALWKVDHAPEKNDPSNHKQRSPACDKKGVSSREGRSATSPLQTV
jgi:hypothetical protein